MTAMGRLVRFAGDDGMKLAIVEDVLMWCRREQLSTTRVLFVSKSRRMKGRLGDVIARK